MVGFLMESAYSNRQNLILMLIGGGLVLVALAAFFALPQSQGKSAKGNLLAAPADVRFPVPDVRLTDLQGLPVAFTDYEGQVIFYNAWATWCPPCKEEMPTLQAYYQAHQHEGFVVIAIEDGQPVDEVAAFVKELGLTFPVWPDLKWVATETFRINSLPTSYVIDRKGIVRQLWRGAITRDALEKYVSPLLKE